MKTSHRRARARHSSSKTHAEPHSLNASEDSGGARALTNAVRQAAAVRSLVVCAPSLGRPDMPAAEFGPAAASDARNTPAEVFHVMAQHASHYDKFAGVVIAPMHYDPTERQKAAVTAAHHFRLRSEAVRAVEGIVWVAVPSSIGREQLAQIIADESQQLRHEDGTAWVLALWAPDAFGIESDDAPAFVSAAVFGEALTL